MRKPDKAAAGWPAYLEQAMLAARIHSKAELARRSGADSSLISRWFVGVMPSIPHLRKLVPVLGIPLPELMVAAGHIEPAEAKMNQTPAPPRVVILTPEETIDRWFADYPETAESLKRVLRMAMREHGLGNEAEVTGRSTHAKG